MNEYTLAMTAEDYSKASEFLGDGNELLFPTILAVRDGELIGVFGTQESGDGFATAGPVQVNTDNPSLVAGKMLMMYDSVRYFMGSMPYYITIAQDAPDKYRRFMDDMFELVGQTDEYLIYRRG